VLLLSKGADPNLPVICSKGGSQTTPIWLAAERGSLETVKELLRHGARASHRARLGRDAGVSTPLDVAKNREIFRLLKKAQDEEVESMVKVSSEQY